MNMKTKVKRIGAMVLACVMLWGVSVSVSAAEEPEPTESPKPPHECSFSYMGMEYTGTNHVTWHTYKDVNSIERKCEVVVDQYRDIYGCVCGEIMYRNKHGVVRHTVRCGQ
ncbi:MAG: hypothetical protein K2I01_06820 [Lachnospiraceae bacterium]|nr:hypothetical protein [Lachnospiraceae bacterium]